MDNRIDENENDPLFHDVVINNGPLFHDNNQENLPPPSPIVRQQTGFLTPPRVEPEFNPFLVEDGDPLLQIHGQFPFRIMPNGLSGYTERDYRIIVQNDGWYDSGSESPFEEEDFPDSGSEADSEDGDVADDVIIHPNVNP